MVLFMLKIFKKAYLIPYEDSAVCPSVEKARLAIAKFCGENGFSYEFLDDNAVVINGKEHEIRRGLTFWSRGNYVIKCREK